MTTSDKLYSLPEVEAMISDDAELLKRCRSIEGDIYRPVLKQLRDTMRKVKSMEECDKAAAHDITMLVKSREECMREVEWLKANIDLINATLKCSNDGLEAALRENERLRKIIKECNFNSEWHNFDFGRDATQQQIVKRLSDRLMDIRRLTGDDARKWYEDHPTKHMEKKSVTINVLEAVMDIPPQT